MNLRFMKEAIRLSREMMLQYKGGPFGAVIVKGTEIVGKGWRSTVKGNVINLQVGYSHPVDFKLPAGVSATQENPGSFTLFSHDKQLLGQICANIQSIRPVEPYKLKGIRLEGQVLRQKVRKAAGV